MVFSVAALDSLNLDASALKRLHPAIVVQLKSRYLFTDHSDVATKTPGLRRPLTTAFLPADRLVVCDVSTKDTCGRETHPPAVLEPLKPEDGDDEQLGDYTLTGFVDSSVFKRKPRFGRFATNVCEAMDGRTLAIRDQSRISFFSPRSLVSDNC
jgi:hypothetical protein